MGATSAWFLLAGLAVAGGVVGWLLASPKATSEVRALTLSVVPYLGAVLTPIFC
jgi:hypothetical protein